MNILEIKNLKKTFRDLTAVDDLSLSISKGDIHGVLGPNGAGKSTTMNCLLGLVTPDSGEVYFGGDKKLKSWKKNIGYVPQELAIYDEMTAEENVKFFCSLYGFSKAKLREKVAEALEFTGLTEVKDKKAGTFSGGMKRRLNIACGLAQPISAYSHGMKQKLAIISALLHEPKLIIMDEPTVGIDPQSRNLILENVKKLNEKGATVIYTTHYMPEVEEICNKITVIDHGKTIAAGTKQEIIEKLGKKIKVTVTYKDGEDRLDAIADTLKKAEGVSSVKAADSTLIIKHHENVTVMENIISASVENGAAIVNIVSEEPSLEEVFLTLTGKETRDN